MDSNSPHIPAVDELVLIRRADADDAGFIFSYWLRDYYERSAFAKGIGKSLFMRLHHLLLERIIARSVIFIACDSTDPSVCYGFICTEGDTLHYLYVKRHFRKLGLSRRLLAAAGMSDGPKQFTHLTDEGISLRRRWPLSEYNPYLV